MTLIHKSEIAQSVLQCIAQLHDIERHAMHQNALAHYLYDPQVPIDDSWCENLIRLIAVGRNRSLFAGLLQAGKRADAVMDSVQSAKLNRHDPYAYLKDVLARLRISAKVQLITTRS